MKQLINTGHPFAKNKGEKNQEGHIILAQENCSGHFIYKDDTPNTAG